MEQNIAAGTRYVTALMWEFHGDLRLVAAAYYAGDRGIAREQLNYHNPDVVAYVQAVRRQYMLRKVSGREAGKEVNTMKLRWLIPVAFLVPLRLSATDASGWGARRHDHDQPEGSHDPPFAAGV